MLAKGIRLLFEGWEENRRESVFLGVDSFLPTISDVSGSVSLGSGFPSGSASETWKVDGKNLRVCRGNALNTKKYKVALE